MMTLKQPLLSRFALLALAALPLVGLAGSTACGGGIPLTEETLFQAKPSLTPATFDYANATLEEVHFEAEDGTELYGWHIDRSPSRATVMYFGGQGFHLVLSRAFVDDMLREVPADLFLVDYRGYGGSNGTPSVDKLKSDALQAWAVLTERRGVDPGEIVVHGHSMGSFVATHLAAERPAAGLVLESGVTDVKGWTRAVMPWYLRLFVGFEIAESFEGESSLERVGRIISPSLFVVGDKDAVTPPTLTRQLHEASAAASKRLTVVEEAEHNNLHDFDGFLNAYRDFLAEVSEMDEESDGENAEKSPETAEKMPDEPSRPLQAHAWKHRPVVVFALEADDELYRRQIAILEEHAEGVGERDIIIYRVLGSAEGPDNTDSRGPNGPLSAAEARALRERFEPGGEFLVVLVGKDTGEKLRSRDHVTADELFGTIDAMPMRQREMREQE